jgi:hypothetical protein
MRKIENHIVASTKAGSNVDKRDEREVEPSPPPVRVFRVSEAVDVALPLEDPMLGSLLGSYILRYQEH